MGFHTLVANAHALRALAVLTSLLAVARPSHAQARFGIQLGSSTGEYPIGVGIREWIPTLDHIDLLASGFLFFRALRVVAPDLGIDAAYRFRPSRAAVQPYVGVGFGLTHYPVTYRPEWYGLNLFSGIRFAPQPAVAPFLEVRLKIRTGGNTFEPGARLIFVAGLLF